MRSTNRGQKKSWELKMRMQDLGLHEIIYMTNGGLDFQSTKAIERLPSNRVDNVHWTHSKSKLMPYLQVASLEITHLTKRKQWLKLTVLLVQDSEMK